MALTFVFTYALGLLFEKIKVPWIFSALFLGALLAVENPFVEITSGPVFEFLAQLGMYLLLFIIGFEMNLKEVKKNQGFIVKATVFIIFLEMVFGSMLVHFVFGYAWFISAIVALSFATVGEAVLIPILDELGLIKTDLGQIIIGIGSVDDILEVFLLLVVVILVSSDVGVTHQIATMIISLLVLFMLAAALIKDTEGSKKFTFKGIENMFLLILAILFLFIGIGEYSEATSIAALLAGVGIRTSMAPALLKGVESELKTMCYGFFAPIFFLWIGSSIDVSYLSTYPLQVLLVVVVSSCAKLIGSVIIAEKKIGVKKSVLLSLGLSVRFSTGIIIMKILLDEGLIEVGLYSVILASSIVFTLILPVIFSNLLTRWEISKMPN